ncbi:hypothetical protein DY000_02043709 [Brassica cretica]|uniref:Uncharacterized protein n=1 Tax=Brassica cretica TaxID=69181 RepID=A0ABQ7BQE6_BRACR|nr:hypothetical protein DY000_02043709 [Brassica cretica]
MWFIKKSKVPSRECLLPSIRPSCPSATSLANIVLLCTWTRCPCSTTGMEKTQTREGRVLDMANQKEDGLVPFGHFETLK